MYAFVHPDAAPVAKILQQLGYRVQMRDTPFNLTDVTNQDFVKAQKSGCCGEKEYLKLYSWLLLDYPAVIHLDLDTLDFNRPQCGPTWRSMMELLISCSRETTTWYILRIINLTKSASKVDSWQFVQALKFLQGLWTQLYTTTILKGVDGVERPSGTVHTTEPRLFKDLQATSMGIWNPTDRWS
ncbi:MAG: hypothetical protein SGARI_000934 [Bacillariaceae sp.]